MRSLLDSANDPKLAFDLESEQIEKLDIAPMVSLSDHDNIKAPMMLRSVPSARQILFRWSGRRRMEAVVPPGRA